MTRKLKGKILSGCLLVLGMTLLLAPSANAQGFRGGIKKYVITGNTGDADVTLVGFPGGPITSNSSGYYSTEVPHGWSGIVTPNKEGYTFKPGNMRFDPVKAPQDGRDFTATIRTFTISGSCGLQPGVVLNGFPEGPVTVSDNGRYSVTVPYGWSGTITPILEGFEFRPPTKNYQPVKRDMTTENYTVEKLVYTIGGTVSVPGGPVAGVVLKGLPGNPVTGPDGRYSVKVDYKWSGSATATKDGYVFDPPTKIYENLDASMIAEDFYGSVIQYTISGNVGVPGVKLNGLPGNTMSDASGQYIAQVDYGVSGKITPVKDGYEFSPPQILFQKVTKDIINKNFEAKEILIKIAGSVGLTQAGIQLQGLTDPNGQSVMTNGQGRYEAVVPYGFYGEVTPLIEGYTFTPQSKLYENLTRNRITENYSASRIKHTISGQITGDGNVRGGDIRLDGFPDRNVKTNPIGAFTTQVPYDWSGKVIPRKAGLAFNPPELEYFGVRQNMQNQDFTASVKMYAISGRVRSVKGQPVENVSVMTGLGSEYSSVTDMDGRFELVVPHGWTGQVSFMKQGYDFTPPAMQIKPVTSDQKLDASAKVKKFKIEGEIVIQGEPVPGVTITATNGGNTDLTDMRGQFTVEVPYNWSGELIPTKEGWEFDPPSKPYESVMEDINERVGAPSSPTSPPLTPPIGEPGMSIDPGTSTDDGIPLDPFPQDDEEPVDDETPPASGSAENAEVLRLQEELERLRSRLATREPNNAMSPPSGMTEVLPGRDSGMPEGAGPVINSVLEGDLSMVLQDLAMEAEVTIVADPEIQGTVSVDFTGGRIRLEQALDTLLAGSGYSWRKTPYYYLVSSANLEDRSFTDGSETRQVKLAFISGQAAVALLNPSFAKYVQADPERRQVSVTAPRTLADRIVSDLKNMDKRPRQVLLDARIVAMEKGDLLNLGVEWGWPRVNAGMFSNDHSGFGDPALDFSSSTPWGVQIGYSPDGVFTEALSLQLNMMVENEEAKIVANPQVIAQDSKPAEIRVVREEYYMMSDLTQGGGLTFSSRAELEKVESGTILEITPYISDTNDIVLVVATELSDSVPRGRETDLPIVTRRTTRNEVVVKDGGTVAIAGLQQHKTVETNKRVPGLSKLPILGKLFQNDNNSGSSREIAFFITARLIPEVSQLNRQMQRQAPSMGSSSMSIAPAGTPAVPVAPMNQPSNMQIPSNDFQAELMNSIRRSPSQ